MKKSFKQILEELFIIVMSIILANIIAILVSIILSLVEDGPGTYFGAIGFYMLIAFLGPSIIYILITIFLGIKRKNKSKYYVLKALIIGILMFLIPYIFLGL